MRGRGAGPKTSTSVASQQNNCAQLEKENEKFRRQAETYRGHLELLEKEKSEMDSRLESLAYQIAS